MARRFVASSFTGFRICLLSQLRTRLLVNDVLFALSFRELTPLAPMAHTDKRCLRIAQSRDRSVTSRPPVCCVMRDAVFDSAAFRPWSAGSCLLRRRVRDPVFQMRFVCIATSACRILCAARYTFAKLFAFPDTSVWHACCHHARIALIAQPGYHHTDDLKSQFGRRMFT